MRKLVIIWFMIFAIATGCDDDNFTGGSGVDERDILEKLQSLSGIDVTEITPQNGYDRQFEIYVSQPLDHQNPDGATFQQLLYLSHVDELAPVVFMPSGYNARPTTSAELSGLLQANQIYVAHRFMTGAQPEPMEWQYLTIEQSAADHHRIVELFKEFYSGKWISYGASKNGETVLFHRRFYPNDVNVTVAKVAPLSLGIEDPRYRTFLETVGDETTRNKIKQYQIALLRNRTEILPMIRNYMDNSGLSYSVSEGVILEFEACEYSFAFWQVTDHDISQIPDSNSTALELYTYLESGGYIPYYSDGSIEFYEPVYYQAYTELGYYGFITDHLDSLLVSVPNPSYSFFAPKDVDLTFKPEVIPDVIQWLQTAGNNIIYIYGELDPWTAGAIELTGQTNVLKIVQAEANHSIRLSDLDEKELVYSTLESWLEIEVVESEAYHAQVDQMADEYPSHHHFFSNNSSR